MLHATGLTREDLDKAQVGIASMWFEGNSCNMHLLSLSEEIKKGVIEHGMVGMRFNTVGVSDGISMGTNGKSFSLPSRDIIADSIETITSAQWYDALVTVPGCDKNMPGSLIAMARLNRPALMVYGGTIRAGCWKGKKLDIVSAFQSYGEALAGTIGEDERREIVRKACPGAGACGGMYTANTMATAIEAMGMSLPYSSSYPADSDEKRAECRAAGAAIRKLLELDLKPRDIMTPQAFKNALVITMALGGSTNAVLHLIAMARAAGISLRKRGKTPPCYESGSWVALRFSAREKILNVSQWIRFRFFPALKIKYQPNLHFLATGRFCLPSLTLDDIQTVSNEVPFIADLKPSGTYVMEDLSQVGGIPGVLKYLLREGLIDGSCMTVTGKSLAENLNPLPDLLPNQPIVKSLKEPIKESEHIQVLKGNLAPEGSVAKITGKEGLCFEGTARVYDSEEDMLAGLEQGEIRAGTVVVIRYEGPKGGPGMPEMLTPTSAIMGAGLGKDVALITDGRFSGGSHGFLVGHITPKAQDGGPIALVRNGDTITIDARNNTISVAVSDADMAKRRD
jgi:dihydroxy-acid dehydratase